MIRTILLVIIIASAVTALPQEPLNPNQTSARYLPKATPTLDFRKLSLVKLIDDLSLIRVIRPRFAQEQKTRVVSKNIPRQETRERTLPDGKTQSYTVTLMDVVHEGVTYVAETIVGEERMSIPMSEIKAFDLKGKPISADELPKRLSKSTHAFVIETDPGTELIPLDAFYDTVIRPETLRLHVPLDATLRFADKKPQ